MNAGKFADRSACSSPIEPELSMTKRMSTSLLTVSWIAFCFSDVCSYFTPFSGWSRQASRVGSASATPASKPVRVTMDRLRMGRSFRRASSRIPLARAVTRAGA